jgi:hypothetical protein
MGKIWIPGGGGAGTGSDDCTASKAQVLVGYTAVTRDSGDEAAAGSMPNNGGQSGTLNCGQSKVIPAGYTSGGTVTANSLASQTSANAAANQISSGKTAWVNGKKVTGTLTERGQYQNGGAAFTGSYFAVNSLPEGIYRSNGASWAPEARCTADKLRNALGITAGKIKKGETIAGVSGNVEAYRYYQADVYAGSKDAFTNINGTPQRCYVVEVSNFSFTPISVVVSAYINHAYMTAYDGYHYLEMPRSAYYDIDGTTAILTKGKIRVPVSEAGTYTVRIVGKD